MRLVPPPTAATVYLSSAQIRAMFGGRGPLWISRQIKSNGFPRPVRFGNGRLYYWKKSDVEAWREAAERAA